MSRMSNMYKDSVKQINYFVGCRFDCVYCEKSFQKQMKRQKNRCLKCYNYEPHTHLDRLEQYLPRTDGEDEFIWVNSSSDIYFANETDMNLIIKTLKDRYPERTFLFQSKAPEVFMNYDFPKHWILCTTIETNDILLSYEVSKAPATFLRSLNFRNVDHPRKFVTIEPILKFDHDELLRLIKNINPERVYIGFDTKDCGLPEPTVDEVKNFIKDLEKFTKVKTKYLKEREDE